MSPAAQPSLGQATKGVRHERRQRLRRPRGREGIAELAARHPPTVADVHISLGSHEQARKIDCSLRASEFQG